MSDNLPIEIQEDIIKRLSLKSVIQFRSVSKAWKSLIDSSRFINDYNAKNTQLRHHLLVKSDYCMHGPSYYSILDDATFPNEQVEHTKPPLLVNMLIYPVIIGISHGLVCVYGGYYRDGSDKNMAVLWNISIGKAVAVVVPNVAEDKEEMFSTVLGFGVCRETNDPKIVKVTQIKNWKDMESETCIPYQVEVFTLSTGSWRSSYSNLPRKSIELGCRHGVDGFFYWLATDRSVIADGEQFRSYKLIISFDMSSEKFREINLPDNLVYNSVDISNIRESLVVFGVEDTESDQSDWVYVAWRMEDGVPNSFTRLFTICTEGEIISGIMGFRRSGELVIEYEIPEYMYNREEPWENSGTLVVYEPSSKCISKFGFVRVGPYQVFSYKETLLLLDQPEFTVYEEGKGHIWEVVDFE